MRKFYTRSQGQDHKPSEAFGDPGGHTAIVHPQTKGFGFYLVSKYLSLNTQNKG